MGYRIQGAGCRWSARPVSDAVSVRGIVRKHNCALPTLYPKHSNARAAIITLVLPTLSPDPTCFRSLSMSSMKPEPIIPIRVRARARNRV